MRGVSEVGESLRLRGSLGLGAPWGWRVDPWGGGSPRGWGSPRFGGSLGVEESIRLGSLGSRGPYGQGVLELGVHGAGGSVGVEGPGGWGGSGGGERGGCMRLGDPWGLGGSIGMGPGGGGVIGFGIGGSMGLGAPVGLQHPWGVDGLWGWGGSMGLEGPWELGGVSVGWGGVFARRPPACRIWGRQRRPSEPRSHRCLSFPSSAATRERRGST